MKTLTLALTISLKVTLSLLLPTKSLLYFFLYDVIGEAGGVWYDKVPLVPGRVVPEIFYQQAVNEVQLVLPEAELLNDPLSVTEN